MSRGWTKVPHPVAEILVGHARRLAETAGVPMAIALVDGEGGLQMFSRMDGTLPVSTELAMSKAYTAAVLRMTSAELGRQAQPGAPLYGINSTHSGRLVLFGGGVPLRLAGKVVGGLGISGGTVEEDVRVAEPVAGLLGQMERWAVSLAPLVPLPWEDGARVSGLSEALVQALGGVSPSLPAEERAAVAGGICLAVSG